MVVLISSSSLVLADSSSEISSSHSPSSKVLINSNNWADVYSVSLFQALKGEKAFFLNDDSIRDLDSQLSKENSLVLYSSKSHPLVSSLKKKLTNEDWTVDFEVKSDSLFMDLDPMVDNYYILWDQQASLSLPLLGLAKKTRSWVFVVSQNQTEDLVKHLSKKNLNGVKIILVGDLPLSMHEKLDSFITSKINEDSIQKTVDTLFNLQMNSLTSDLALSDTTLSNSALSNSSLSDSALLVTGSVLESDLFMSKQPILLVSDTFVSKDFISLVKDYSLHSFSVVENSLFPFAQELKKELDFSGIENVSFFLKFGQSSLVQEGEIVSLNTFPLPKADINLTITSVDYNPSLNQLSVYIKNEGKSNAYLFASIDIFALKNETYLTSVGSTSAQEIGPLEKTVLVFNTTIDVDTFSDLKSKIFLAYGESKKQLDKHLISKETGLSPIYFDVRITSSEMNKIDLDVSEVLYRSDKNAFEIVIKNPEEINLEGVLRVQNVLVDGISKDFSQSVLIPSKRSVHLVPADLSSKDQEMNKNISLEVQYKKSGEKYIRFLHIVDEFSAFTVIPLVLSALLTFLIIAFFEQRRWSYRRKEKKSGIRWVKK